MRKAAEENESGERREILLKFKDQIQALRKNQNHLQQQYDEQEQKTADLDQKNKHLSSQLEASTALVQNL